LVRMDAVRCIIEVKRTLAGNMIQEMQDYFTRLADSFSAGGHVTNFLAWAVAFHSDLSKPLLLEQLNKTYDPTKSVGLLLVLDAAPAASDLVAKWNAVNEAAKPKGVAGTHVKKFVQEVSVPNGCFFQRSRKVPGYELVEDDLPALLNFMMMFETFIRASSTRTDLRLSHFVAQAKQAEEAPVKSPAKDV